MQMLVCLTSAFPAMQPIIQVYVHVFNVLTYWTVLLVTLYT